MDNNGWSAPDNITQINSKGHGSTSNNKIRYFWKYWVADDANGDPTFHGQRVVNDECVTAYDDDVTLNVGSSDLNQAEITSLLDKTKAGLHNTAFSPITGARPTAIRKLKSEDKKRESCSNFYMDLSIQFDSAVEGVVSFFIPQKRIIQLKEEGKYFSISSSTPEASLPQRHSFLFKSGATYEQIATPTLPPIKRKKSLLQRGKATFQAFFKMDNQSSPGPRDENSVSNATVDAPMNENADNAITLYSVLEPINEENSVSHSLNGSIALNYPNQQIRKRASILNKKGVIAIGSHGFDKGTSLPNKGTLRRESALKRQDGEEIGEREPSASENIGSDLDEPSYDQLQPAKQKSAINKLSAQERQEYENVIYNPPGINEDQLNELRATAVAGNDFSLSILYTTGVVIQCAGKYAPLSAVVVAFVLYFNRFLYAEVFSALPINGGTYTALLNVGYKLWAGFAAVLLTLSNIGNTVGYGSSAASYLNYQFSFFPILVVALCIIVIFSIMTIGGIEGSSNLSVCILFFHFICIGIFFVSSTIYIVKDHGTTLKKNILSTSSKAQPQSNWFAAIFWGFCVGMQGTSGFESSSNYNQEQKPGVFPKTLRNMWLMRTIINPTIAVMNMGVFSIDYLVDNSFSAIPDVAEKILGRWFKILMVFDLATVLCGAVLSAIVSVTGMYRQVALDGMIPQFFLQINPCRKTTHWITIVFAVFAIVTRLAFTDMNVISAVYAISFLGASVLFCFANIMLKVNRGRIPRKPIININIVFLITGIMIAAFIGNIFQYTHYLQYVILYFIIIAAIIVGTFLRGSILRFLALYVIPANTRLGNYLFKKYREYRDYPVVFFTNSYSITTLNRAVKYVVDNENTSTVQIMHCFDSDIILYVDEETGEETVKCQDLATREFIRRLEHECGIIDRLYPKLTIDLVLVASPFSPLTVNEISEELSITKNRMFIACPGSTFPGSISQFGGIRVITT